MDTNDMVGLNYNVFLGDADLTNFKEIDNISNAEFDNSSDDVVRNFLAGGSKSITTNFSSTLTLTVTNLNTTNQEKFATAHRVEAGDTIDGTTLKAGTAGATRIGAPVAGAEAVSGVIKMVPKIAGQQDKTIWLTNATVSVTDAPFDDNWLELQVTVSGDLWLGEIVAE